MIGPGLIMPKETAETSIFQSLASKLRVSCFGFLSCGLFGGFLARATCLALLPMAQGAYSQACQYILKSEWLY